MGWEGQRERVTDDRHREQNCITTGRKIHWLKVVKPVVKHEAECMHFYLRSMCIGGAEVVRQPLYISALWLACTVPMCMLK